MKYRVNGHRIMAPSVREVHMFAVVFEVLPAQTAYQRYLDVAAALRPKLDAIDGFLSIERFRGITDPGWILSLSLWRDEAALVQWRGDGEHHAAQAAGRQVIFDDYRIRVVRIVDEDNGTQTAAIGLHEYPDVTQGKLYESLAAPEKRIALHDFSAPQAALAWRANVAERLATPARILVGTVARDYGLFERAQAPQHFPMAHRRKARP
jgi:heme-degrading monooxygenase HmoA